MKNSITLTVTRSQLWACCFLCLLFFLCAQPSMANKPLPKEKNDPVVAQLVANPFVGNCCLSVDAPENTTLFIRMVNNIGAEVLNTKVLVQKGNNYITLPASQLSNGFYTLQLRGKNGKLISVLKGEKR